MYMCVYSKKKTCLCTANDCPYISRIHQTIRSNAIINVNHMLKPTIKATKAIIKQHNCYYHSPCINLLQPFTQSMSKCKYLYLSHMVHIYIYIQCQPWINKPLDCLIGGIPFKYHIVTIWRVPPQLINHGLLVRG